MIVACHVHAHDVVCVDVKDNEAVLMFGSGVRTVRIKMTRSGIENMISSVALCASSATPAAASAHHAIAASTDPTKNTGAMIGITSATLPFSEKILSTLMPTCPLAGLIASTKPLQPRPAAVGSASLRERGGGH